MDFNWSFFSWFWLAAWSPCSPPLYFVHSLKKQQATKMALLARVMKSMERIAPQSLADHAWDNVGLLVGMQALT